MSKRERHQEKVANTKRRDLKILWSSNGVWTNSGYASEQRDLLFRLIKDGWNVAQSAFWGHDGYPVWYRPKMADGSFFREDWKDLEMKIYPKMADPWGGDAMAYHAKDFGAHAVFCMQDIWTLDPQFLTQLPAWIPWLPIDKSPAPVGVLEKLRYAYKIVTFSNFGKKELERKGFASSLILEGTDTDVFKPLDRAECRKELGLPEDVFLFSMIAANKENPPRKGFQEALEAFKMFHDKHPNSAILFHVQQPSPTGFPLKGFADHLGILANTFFVDDYRAIYQSGPDRISKLMNASNVLLHPSQTEGFGLTVIEAAACGIPAIVNDCTSMPEMVVDGETGVICKTGKPRWGNDNAYVYPADVDSLYEQMERIYGLLQEDEAKVRDNCRNHVIKNYNIEDTAKRWIEFLEKLQEELLPLQPPPVAVQSIQSNISTQ